MKKNYLLKVMALLMTLLLMCMPMKTFAAEEEEKSETEYSQARSNPDFENFELILVCDDDSYNYVAAAKKNVDGYGSPAIVSVIKLAYYQGVEAAICAGDDLAVGDFVYEFDNIRIGERTAEQIKIHVGSALSELDEPPADFIVQGPNQMPSLPV